MSTRSSAGALAAATLKVSLPAVRTTVTDLGDSRVRVQAEVAPDEVEAGIEQAARALGRNMKLAGFRKGKIPPAIVVQRLGREALLEEMLRDRLWVWYQAAVREAGLSTVGAPSVSVDSTPDAGEPLQFTVEVGVRPEAELGEWRGLEVARREARAGDDDVDAEIERLRERLARLETVERPAADGDFLVVDYAGSSDGQLIPGAEARDRLIELAPGTLLPGFVEGLRGAAAGEERKLDVTFPADFEQADLAGHAGSFAVTVKEVKVKLLPPIDDDFASAELGFETLAELREDVRAKMLEVDERAVEREWREAVVAAAAQAARVTIPEPLVEARAQEAWERTLHALEHRGISKEAYLRIAGRPEEELLKEARPDAELSLRQEAVVAALIKAEGIEPSDEELLAALAEGGRAEDPAELLAALERDGRLAELRAEVAARAAVDRLVAEAKPISLEQAAAREKLWTPEKAR